MKPLQIVSGLAVLDEIEGSGPPASKIDQVIFNMKIWLHRGEEVPLNALQAKNLPPDLLRVVGNETFVDHSVRLGRREVIAGIERSLAGMKAGGYRKVEIGPHLAYRDKGIVGLIPPNALLIVELWLREIHLPGSTR